MTTSVVLSGSASMQGKFLHQIQASLGTTYSANPTVNFSRGFSPTDVGVIYYATLTVPAAGTTLDLTNLANPLGGTALTFTSVKYVIVWNTDTAISLTVGGGTSAVLPTLPVITHGDAYSQTGGFAVAAGTKNLLLVAGSATVAVEIMLAGS